MTTTQNNPFTAWQSFWQNQGTSVGQTSNVAQNFWQANACYWQTVNSIMSARGNSVAQWWQQAPQHLSELAGCKTGPEFIEACMKWQAQTTAQACQLNETTQAERAHLLKQWQQLAGRSGFNAGGTTTSSYTTWPQTQTVGNGSTGTTTTKQQTPQTTSSATSNTSQTSTWQPNFLQGRFTPGTRTTATMQTTTAQTTVQPQVQTTTNTNTETSTEQSSDAQVSSTSTSFSRSSTGAAQVIAATTRRSVLARNSSRPRRAAGGR